MVAAAAVAIAILLTAAAPAAAVGPPTGVPDAGLLIDAVGLPTDFGPQQDLPGVTVNAASGNLLIHEIDDRISDGTPDGTPTLGFDRWYNSADSARRDVGAGWRTGLGYDVELTGIGTNTLTLNAPSLHAVVFSRSGSTYSTGSDWTLVENGGGGYVATDLDLQRVYRFGGSGALLSIEAGNGAHIRFDYTTAGGQPRLSAVYAADERATRISYDGTGSMIEIDNPASEHGYFRYSGTQLTEQETPAGQVRTYAYDVSGRLTARTGPDGAYTVTYDALGRVATLRMGAGTPTQFAYVSPRPADCDATAVAQTDVTRPDGIVDSYCFDADGNLVGLPPSADQDADEDEDGPDVYLAGGLTARDGWYVGPGTLGFVMGADDGDDGSGVASIEAHDGETPIATAAAPCAPSCPATFQHTHMVDLTALSEGRASVAVSATDQAGNRGPTDEIEFDVDRTPPTVPTDLALGALHDDGTATLSWIPGIDGALPDGRPGSGGVRTEWRVQLNGVWSAWTVVEDGFVELTGLTQGQQVRARVRALDAVGNRSAMTEDIVVAQQPVSTATSRQTAGFDSCTPRIRFARERNTQPRYREFEEVKTLLGAELAVYCIVNNTQRVELTGDFAVSTGGNGWQKLANPLGSDRGSHRVRNKDDVFVRGVNANCNAWITDQDGENNYTVEGEITYIRNGARDKTHTYRTDVNHPAHLTCPGPETRQGRIRVGWHALKRFSPTVSDTQSRAPSRQLRRALGSQPWTPANTRRAWDAHHIVPHGDPAATRLQVALWRCRVHPNSALNGVYLRGSGLRKRLRSGRPNRKYDLLRAYDKRNRTTLSRRVYHGDTFKSAYVAALYDKIDIGGLQDRCAIGNSLESQLSTVEDQLQSNSFGHGVADPSH